MSEDRPLIIGLGNLLMGDDGAGIHIIHELRKRDLSESVDMIDGGTAGIGLVDILSSYKTVIVIDAIMDQGSRYRGIRLFSPDDLLFREEEGGYSIHDMELTSVLRLMKTLNMEIPDIKIIGIPAVHIAPGMGLSEECRRFIPEAVDLVMQRFIKEGGRHDCLR